MRDAARGTPLRARIAFMQKKLAPGDGIPGPQVPWSLRQLAVTTCGRIAQGDAAEVVMEAMPRDLHRPATAGCLDAWDA